MRAPRTLISLLAVVGAGCVVAFAGAGAAIEKSPTPALADAVVDRSDVPATVTAMTWNACGDAQPGCPVGGRPDEVVRAVERTTRSATVGGRTVEPDVVFLQEICSAQVTTLTKSSRLSEWHWAFTAEAPDAVCANGQGRPGVAIASRVPLSKVREVRLPAPDGQGRAAVCARASEWNTTLCTARFSMAAHDPTGDWRARQSLELGKAAGTGRVIVGGDLTDEPASSNLDVLYRDFNECDQGPSGRDGAATQQNWRGEAVRKTDYLFVPAEATVSCQAERTRTNLSDHRPLTGVVRFPPANEADR